MAATEYHWVMTVQSSGGKLATNDGIALVNPGDTRESTYDGVFKAMTGWFGSADVVVLFYSLELNSF